MSTVPTSADRLSKEAADHILRLVGAYGLAAEHYGMTPATTPHFRQAAEAKDAVHRAVVTAVLDLVDWRAVVTATDDAQEAAVPASGEAR